MALGCGGSFMKILLIIFNIIFFLGGAAVLGVGIWLMVDPSGLSFFTDIIPDESDPLWRASTIVLIVVGAATFVVGFFGFCGACRESACMLATYGALLCIILLLEITGAILAIVFQDELEDTLTKEMESQIPNVKRLYTEDEDSATNAAWHAMQYDLECCGANNYTDYTKRGQDIPLTCCVLSNDDYKDPQPENQALCLLLNAEYIHTEGCSQAVIDYLDSKSVILIGIGLGIGLLQIFGIIFAFCLCKEVKEDNVYA